MFNIKIVACKKPLQNPTSLVCGAYCIYIAYFLCKKYSLKVILNRLENKNSDSIVEKFVIKLAGQSDVCRKKFCPTFTFNTICAQKCFC